MQKNVVYNEDCLDMMSKINDNSIDAIVTDPPYGLSAEPDIMEVLGRWMNGERYDHTGVGFMGKCYHPDTDILTESGWKNIKDVEIGDSVYTLSKDHLLIRGNVVKTYIYEIDDTLIHFKHRSCEQFVTMNHNVYVSSLGLKFGFKRSDSLTKSFKFYNQCIPNINDTVKLIDINGSKYDTNLFLKLLGLYIGDGYTVIRKGNRREKLRTDNFWGIRVKKERKILAIRSTLELLQISYNERYDYERKYVTFECHDDTLVEYFHKIGNSENKHIPNELLKLPPNNLIYLLDGLIESDGHVTKSGQRTYSTISNKLADDIQILCLICGFSACKSIQKKGGIRYVFGKMIDCKTAYRLSILPSDKYLNFDQRENNIHHVIYKGNVHCVELNDHHLLYTRYNGKPVWSGNSWDSFVPGPEYWKECYRVLKPGGHILVFGGTRTFDLISIALRMVGFERRDTLMWLFGSGFPKGLNISKAIDKKLGNERKVIGQSNKGSGKQPNKLNNQVKGCTGIGYADGSGKSFDITMPGSELSEKFDGWNTNLKPAYEPILLCRKPIEKGLTIAENVMKWGTGGINIDGCRVPLQDFGEDSRLGGNGSWSTDKAAKNIYEGGYSGDRIGSNSLGRYPANILHDGSNQVTKSFPDAKGQQGDLKGHDKKIKSPNGIYGEIPPRHDHSKRTDSTKSSSRFFYCAKTTKSDRNEGVDKNNHPTVKPTSLMCWLVRLITPPGGIVYDPFAGTGSTGKASILEGFDFIGSELDPEYTEIANARVKYAVENKDKLQHYSKKVNDVLPKIEPINENPYF